MFQIARNSERGLLADYRYPVDRSRSRSAGSAIGTFTAVVTSGEHSDRLMLHVYSVADFDATDRLSLVAAVFDDYPELRPLKCGPGDPPRIKVTSMTAVLCDVQRPITYLLVRSAKPEYEGGELNIYRRRGGYIATRRGPELIDTSLLPHSFTLSYDKTWFDEPGRLDQLTAFFTAMCEAMDAYYGSACSRSMWLGRRDYMPRNRGNLFAQRDRELEDVMWLNYFGPGWLRRTDRLSGLGYRETLTINGGLVLQTTDSPFVHVDGADPMTDYPWKRPLVDALGVDTFKWAGQNQGEPGELVPSWSEHFAASPGTDEMPWANWRADEADRKRAARHKSFPSKARKTERLIAARPNDPAILGSKEFSTNIDLADLKSDLKALAALVGGDLQGDIGKSLLAEISAAPHETERAYQLAVAPDGVPELVEFRYFMDDVDEVDVYLFGSDRFEAACLQAFGFQEADD